MNDVMIAPGGTLGVLGSGQLGRMLCQKAREMGYRTVVWSGGMSTEPVQGVADVVLTDDFDDGAALTCFCSEVDVVTVEFENIPVDLLRKLQEVKPVYPDAHAVGVAQNREKEKTFLRDNELRCTPFEVVSSAEELGAALASLGRSVLKTAAFGYDGRGQVKLEGGEDAVQVWAEFGAERGVLEKWVEFETEISVMVARCGGQVVCYDPAENIHREHVLDCSIVPARVSSEVAFKAQELARRLVEVLDYRGILGVEFFVEKDGGLLVNEMAPRPHNSGHHTMDACGTSQFEQQLRAVCGLSLGDPGLCRPVVMLNLLGDLWRPGRLQESLAEELDVKWHFYGKTGYDGLRKCGHANFLGDDALTRARDLKARCATR